MTPPMRCETPTVSCPPPQTPIGPLLMNDTAALALVNAALLRARRSAGKGSVRRQRIVGLGGVVPSDCHVHRRGKRKVELSTAKWS